MVTSYFRENKKPNWAFQRLCKRVKNLNSSDINNDNDNEEISLFNPVSGFSPISGLNSNNNSNNGNLSRLKNNSSPSMDRQIKAFKLPPNTITSIDCEC